MGLFSDYLEECRDRVKIGGLDPCMIISGCFEKQVSSYQSIYRKFRTYSNSDDDKKKQLIYQQLVKQSSELETIKSGYLLGEKIVLRIWNSRKLQSSLITDTVKLLLSELRTSYYAICDLCQDINRQLNKKVPLQFNPPSESEVRENLMRMLGSSIVAYLQDASVILDISEFRKVVYDFALIIQFFEQAQYNQPSKKIVCYYLEKSFDIKNSRFKCTNCGSYLLEDILYCLNCYERN
ncbi:MAG TPA: hypothetical protein DCW90_02025 [Lachnospiraceae bacterium]|nr:hypothetical protein [Lachnospiraceae bacterium]